MADKELDFYRLWMTTCFSTAILLRPHMHNLLKELRFNSYCDWKMASTLSIYLFVGCKTGGYVVVIISDWNMPAQYGWLQRGPLKTTIRADGRDVWRHCSVNMKLTAEAKEENIGLLLLLPHAAAGGDRRVAAGCSW